MWIARRYKLLATETCLPLPWRQLGTIDRAFSALLSAVPDRSATDALWSQYRLNPFATSLFPRHQHASADSPLDSRGFANSLFLRSRPSQSSSDAAKDIFAPYMRSGCVLSHVSAEQVPLPLPISFPKFFRGVDEETATPLVPEEELVFPQPGHDQVGYTSQDRRQQCLSTAAGAAIGAGPFMCTSFLLGWSCVVACRSFSSLSHRCAPRFLCCARRSSESDCSGLPPPKTHSVCTAVEGRPSAGRSGRHGGDVVQPGG